MKLVKVGTNLIGAFPDSEPSNNLKETYGDEAEILFVPDSTPLEMETEYYVKDPRLLMTVEDVRSCRREDVDKKTDEIIANGFIYPSTVIRFKMDLEHQMSYKSVYDLRSFLTFPYTIKGVGDGYMAFQNETEMANFILYAFGWVGANIQGGWGLKDGLSALNKEELIAWEDPR